jgi:hypothetical protein
MKEFQDIVESVYTSINDITRKGGIAYFRGQSSADWELLSSAHRYVNRINKELGGGLKSGKDIEWLRREETSLFFKFKSSAYHFLDQGQRGAWGYVFAMQHYGLPTRLLAAR